MSWHVAGQAEAAALRRAVVVTLLAALSVVALAVLAGCGSRTAADLPELDIQFGLKSSSPPSASQASALPPASKPSTTPPVALPASVSPSPLGTGASDRAPEGS